MSEARTKRKDLTRDFKVIHRHASRKRFRETIGNNWVIFFESTAM